MWRCTCRSTIGNSCAGCSRGLLERRSDDTADIAQPHARGVCDAQHDPGAVGLELQLANLKALP